MTNEKPQISIRKMQWMIFLLGLFKIPLIGFVRPQLIELSDEKVAIKIKFRRRTKNHLNSMYFGALAVGADVAGGIHAFYFSEKLNKKVSFAFKSIHAEFLKRAETDVIFECSEGAKIKAIITESLEKQIRINQLVRVVARNLSNEIVATFDMEISVKVK
jgi:acyl-coenzyme A thioesterase PaaI-like protein